MESVSWFALWLLSYDLTTTSMSGDAIESAFCSQNLIVAREIV